MHTLLINTKKVSNHQNSDWRREQSVRLWCCLVLDFSVMHCKLVSWYQIEEYLYQFFIKVVYEELVHHV